MDNWGHWIKFDQKGQKSPYLANLVKNGQKVQK